MMSRTVNKMMVEPFAIVSTWFACCVLASWITALVYRHFRVRLQLVAPENSNTLQTLLALMPVVLAGFVTLWVFHPPLAFTLLPDHCHGSLCAPHKPVLAMHSLSGMLLSGSSLFLLGLCLLLVLTGVLRGKRQQALLDCLSRPEPGYRVVESPRVQAWCIGLWWPQAYVSSEAVDTLSGGELRVLLAHEYCHALRRDNLRRLLVTVATLLWPSASRRQLLRDFALSTEQVCDQSAAATVNDVQLVSTTLSRVASDRDTQVLARLSALGRGCWQAKTWGIWLWVGVFWLALWLVLLFSAHGLLEWLLAA